MKEAGRMKRALKIFLITLAVLFTIGCGIIALCVYGAYDYVSRCAHITDKAGITCSVGDTLSIDDLAEFSNYDERSIAGITDGEGEISPDGESITITEADGFVTIGVTAHNARSPEHTYHSITVLIEKD